VALALVAVARGRAHLGGSYVHEVPLVEIKGDNCHVLILGEDWAKIEPFIKDGSFDPLIVPNAPRTARLDPSHDMGALELVDQPFYLYVLNTLKLLFTESYPTSKL